MYCAKNCVCRQTRSPEDFASIFGISCDFKGEGRVHKEDVATMLHRRRKNATLILGMGESTSIVLKIGVG